MLNFQMNSPICTWREAFITLPRMEMSLELPDWLPQLLFWGSAVSLATLVATVVAVPWVVGRLPADYFSQPRRAVLPQDRSFPGLLLMGFKNLLGAVLVLLGIIMLFTPGQGLLTLLVGLLLMNFPGKYRLERTLVARPGVFRALNWLRGRRGAGPMELPVVHQD